MNYKTVAKDILIVVLGNFLLAFGVAFFIIPNSVLSGGVAGIAIAIEPVTHWDPNTVIIGLNALLFVVGFVFLGKSFAVKTILSSILYPSFLMLFAFFASDVMLTDNKILAVIYSGVFVGVGIGLIFRSGASSGGMDIPPLILNKYTHIPLPTLVMLVDGVTVLLGILTFGIEAALYGVVTVWICSYTINKTMMLGSLSAKSVLIISDHYEQLLAEITKDVDRGATLIDATGGYTKEKKKMIMMVITRKQFPDVNKVIQQIDPGAFVIVNDVNEVLGEGFSFEGEL